MGQTQKYRVDTDKGSFEVEVETPMQSSLALMADANASTRNGPLSDTPPEKSFLSRAVDTMSQNPALKSAAHPQSVGDFLSLLIPSGVAESYGAAKRVLSSGIEGARQGSGLKGVLSGFTKGMSKAAESVDLQELGSKNFNARPLSQQMEDLPGSARYPEARPAPERGRMGIPLRSETPEVASSAINEALRPNSAAERVTANAGNPASKAVTGNSAADVVNEVARDFRRQYGARDAAKMLGDELKKRGWSDEDIAKLGISADKVRELAPGPSRTPLVAEQRILDAINKAKQ